MADPSFRPRPLNVRRHFDEELRELEIKVQAMSAAAQDLVAQAVRGLVENNSQLYDQVIQGDDEVDFYYLDIERRIVALFALQTPVATDLRFLTALLHINLHLERVADMAVNIAKIGQSVVDLPRSQVIITHLSEMSGIALKMIAASTDAFARRDMELATKLPSMDDPLDRLNRGMMRAILPISDDKRMLQWAIGMHTVSRQIERIGDHAVDIAEQVAFLITGEFREFTDASHPDKAG
ncbi:MAG TPA: phosphate signaling complex protein PhoU [Actinomycetota bacterium]|nr:phosphate signaling complex protein PhoU [Actinomycetota bacterium]